MIQISLTSSHTMALHEMSHLSFHHSFLNHNFVFKSCVFPTFKESYLRVDGYTLRIENKFINFMPFLHLKGDFMDFELLFAGMDDAFNTL